MIGRYKMSACSQGGPSGLKLRIRVGVSDVRGEPKFRSERVDQLLFGEEVDVLSDENGYLRIKTRDGGNGFISENGTGKTASKPAYKLVKTVLRQGLRLPIGSLLSGLEIKNLAVPPASFRSISYKCDKIELARKYLGVPYLWGGTSEFGIDCAGLVFRVHEMSNIHLPRALVRDRHLYGRQVKSLSKAEQGDLMFFPGHVGIYLGRGKMIHSNLHDQRVSITDFNDGDKYSSKLLAELEMILRV